MHWSDDGRYLYFTYSASDHWERGLLRVDIGSGDVDTILLDASMYRGWRISDDGATVVYTMSDGDRPADVWVTGDDFNGPTRLTELNPQLDDVALARTELVDYLDGDGNRLYGLLHCPIDSRPNRK